MRIERGTRSSYCTETESRRAEKMGRKISIDELPEIYPEGFRVKIVRSDDPGYDKVEGVEGTVTFVEEERIHIFCD